MAHPLKARIQAVMGDRDARGRRLPDAASHALADPPPGQSLDERALELAKAVPSGEEEVVVVILRRAAEVLLERTHGRAVGYRGTWRRGPNVVPLRLPKGCE